MKASWKEIHKYYANNSYDLLLCRGNSFIYADGGWNEKIEVDPRRALESYRITLKEFYNILKPGGFLYIDKFYDNENPQKKYVARIKIGDRPIAKLLVYLEIIPKLKIRRAQFLIHNKDGSEKGLPNITYNLQAKELNELLNEAGFNKIEKPRLKYESTGIFF